MHPVAQPPTMSSREIAVVCEARHNDVAATIRRLFDAGILRESRKILRAVAPSGRGRPIQVYDLTKRDCLVVVSGYSDEVRARIIDRWLQLERAMAEADAATSRNKPLSPAEENARLRRIREIRLTHGIRAAQKAWLTSGLPIVPEMLRPEQGDLLDDQPGGSQH